jgi:hypothetical protein
MKESLDVWSRLPRFEINLPINFSDNGFLIHTITLLLTIDIKCLLPVVKGSNTVAALGIEAHGDLDFFLFSSSTLKFWIYMLTEIAGGGIIMWYIQFIGVGMSRAFNLSTEEIIILDTILLNEGVSSVL